MSRATAHSACRKSPRGSASAAWRCRPALLRGVLAVLHPLGLSQYGPEQVDFLRYRPVLSNRRLKEQLGYVPTMTSSEVFDFYCRTHGLGPGRSR